MEWIISILSAIVTLAIIEIFFWIPYRKRQKEKENK
jgi:preprotein translocase subunit YajC